jgi:hypothetical protein
MIIDRLYYSKSNLVYSTWDKQFYKNISEICMPGLRITCTSPPLKLITEPIHELQLLKSSFDLANCVPELICGLSVINFISFLRYLRLQFISFCSLLIHQLICQFNPPYLYEIYRGFHWIFLYTHCVKF